MTKLLAWLRRTVSRLVFGEALPPVAVPEPAAAPPPVSRTRVSADEVHAGGEYYFKDDILDQLDSYFAVLPGLKKADPEGYAFFSRVGAALIPRQMQIERRYLSPVFLDRMPAIGAVTFVGKKLDEDYHQGDPADGRNHIHARVIYFQKYKHGGHFKGTLQAPEHGCVIYVVTCYYEDPKDPKMKPLSMDFAVQVARDGTVRLLKQRLIGQTVIRKSKHRVKHLNVHRRLARHSEPFQVPTHCWGYPEHLKDWAREHQKTPEAFVPGIFQMIARGWEEATENSMTRVAASKGGETATFAVNILRTPYFFADRDVRTNRRKKIFHIVRTHERVLPDGRVIPVKTHFRGERKFTWNGYDIAITVPGWHHNSLFNANFAAQSLPEDQPVPRNMADMAEAGRIIADHLRAA